MVNAMRTRTSPPATPPAMAVAGTEYLGESAGVRAVKFEEFVAFADGRRMGTIF